jgi:hypothetical protein
VRAAGQELRDAARARQAQVALDRGLAQVGLEQQRVLRPGPVLTTPIVVKRSLASPTTFAARKRNSSAR